MLATEGTMRAGGHDMTEFQPAKGGKSVGSKSASTVLVVTVPMLLLAVIGLFSGSLALGTVEITLLMVIWAAGLIWVWWPGRARQDH